MSSFEESKPENELANYSDTPLNPLEDSPSSPKNEVSIQRYEYRSLSSPIPDPETLQQYNQIVPGFASKYLDLFIEESKHRRHLDNKLLELDQEELRQQGSLLDKNHNRSMAGLAAGFIIALSALGSGVFVAIRGYPWVGGIIGGTTAVGLAGVFVIGKLKEQPSEEIQPKKDDAENLPPKED